MPIYTRIIKKQINEQLLRKPKKLAKINLNSKVKNLLDFSYDDIEIINYDPYPLIKGAVSV
jgi:thymidylate synthase